jgi:hypothetical protein
MFSQMDGPTALRPDFVRALAFSLDEVEISTSVGMRLAGAAIAAVWNGHKGFVAVIVRHAEPARVDRYVHAEPAASEADLDAQTEAALAFAETLGFAMDSPEFAGLDAGERDRRLARWNLMRKVRPLPAPPPQETSLAASAQDAPSAEPSAPAGLVGDIDPAAAARSVSGFDSASGDLGLSSRNVLGRIALVRLEGDPRKLEPLARLLSFF